MSQALQNEVKRLRQELAALTFEVEALRDAMDGLRLHCDATYQRKRGPKPAGVSNGEQATAI